MMNRIISIYGLIDLRDEALCYVGVTDGRLEDRLYGHIHFSEGKSWEFGQWLLKHPVEITLLKTGDLFMEKKIIATYIKSNHMLFNAHDLPEMTPAARKKFNRAQKAWSHLRQLDEYPEELQAFYWEFEACFNAKRLT